MRGEVLSIHIAQGKGERLEQVDEVELVAGRGIRNDRNFDAHPGRPERQLTLVDEGMVAAFNAETGLGIPAEDTRRNVVTRGVSLNELVGVTFRLGQIDVRGVELCQPCKYLGDRIRDKYQIESLSTAEIVAGLVDRAGLCAEILTDGTLRPGDPIEPVP